MANKQETKDAALQHIENNGKCIFRRGWAFRGARAHYISKEDALRLLPQYDFGKGFHVLSWIDGTILEFNELSELDME